MSPYIDANRPIQFTTPLGPNKLLISQLRGREAVSELFQFQIDALTEISSATAAPIDFGALLGQTVTVSIQGKQGGTRYINGMVTSVAQGVREELFTHYRIEIAPNLWKLTRNAKSFIHQQKSVKDILQILFAGLDVDYGGLTGDYQPREFCVQYRETDFNFASRLMEEEGIFYFFKHDDGSHKLMLGDSPQAFNDIPFQSGVPYETGSGGGFKEDRILSWEKVQDLRSGKVTLRDYNFEMPNSNCEGSAPTTPAITAGTVSHNAAAGPNSPWELYDYPGGYAKRFDGIDKGGGEQASELNKIFQDNERTAKLRMEAETAGVLSIAGHGLHPGFTAGYQFTLANHFSDNGTYTLLSVDHDAHQPIGSNSEPYRYTNAFRAIPEALAYRPARVTAEPFVHGPQTAIVVGPEGEEIFTDKYGRIKVQFQWDREGTKDAGSSCWIRVGTPWAGKQWGTVHIPRIGQEVIVAFIEGDPDRPIVVGSVYNADNMPPYTLPDNKTQSGIKSRSSTGGGSANYNEIFFEDKSGSEILRIHAEKDQTHDVENDDTQWVGHDRKTTIDNDETRTVTGNQTLEIQQGNQTNTLDQGNQSTTLKMGNQSHTLNMGNQSNQLDMGNQSTTCNLGAISMEAMQSITLTVGQSKITIDQMGVTIEGLMIKVNAQVQLQEQSMMIQSQASAMMQIQGAITMIN